MVGKPLSCRKNAANAAQVYYRNVTRPLEGLGTRLVNAGTVRCPAIITFYATHVIASKVFLVKGAVWDENAAFKLHVCDLRVTLYKTVHHT